MKKTLDIGTISHGTLRACDLAYAILWELKALDHSDSALLADLACIANDAEEEERDDASDIIYDGIDALQEYAPAFCYVGMHEGDGSDLGCWFDHYAFEDACRDGEILKVGDSSELDGISPEEVGDYDYIAVVSDHGNVTLYAVSDGGIGDEVLGIV